MRSEIHAPDEVKKKIEDFCTIQAQAMYANLKVQQAYGELLSSKVKAGLDSVVWELDNEGKVSSVLQFDELDPQEMDDISKHNDRVVKAKAKMFHSL